MTQLTSKQSNPHEFELVLTRIVDLPRHKLYKAWTTPELLKIWFVPKPWTIADCEVDLRPGGIYRTVMKSPTGEEFPSTGCYLEVVENERVVFTDALLPGFRPAPNPFMTAIITFEDVPGGTRYTARVLHKDEADLKKHEAMGFHEGWGICLDQLVELARTL